MIFLSSLLDFTQYFQVGLVSGGVSKCGDKNIPSYFTRLNYPEIAAFIEAPDSPDIGIILGAIQKIRVSRGGRDKEN